MIDVKEAVNIARDYLEMIYSTTSLRSLLVEEVELSENGNYWYVTFGWDLDMMGTQRTYKIFKISASDGEVLSMKIREVS